MKKIEDYVRSIPDFPEEGIIFRDVTSVLQDAEGLKLAIDSMIALLDGVDFDVVVGTESRGFIFGTHIEYALGKPFVPVRKKGKLPCETVSMTYDLEYGSAEVEMHKDAILPGQKVVLVDDLIATGGTIEACAKIVEQLGGESLKGLKKTLFSKFAQWVFEMDIKRVEDDHLDIDFHYCPLVKAWQKQGCSDEEIKVLCDHAMCGDRGIAESFGCELDLPKTIANGDDICEIRFVRRKK